MRRRLRIVTLKWFANFFPAQAVANTFGVSPCLGDFPPVDPGQTVDEPDFDNNQGVTASFSNATGSTAFNLTMPESKEGMTVTVGIYIE